MQVVESKIRLNERENIKIIIKHETYGQLTKKTFTIMLISLFHNDDDLIV